jgi:peptidyl-prolyl cis-trans isomerase D
MFDAVRNNKRIVQIFLLLITLPFAFWGVDSYVKNAGSGGELASVGGTPVSQLDFQQAMREQQERLRTAMGENFNPAMLETVEARKAVLDNLINQRLLALDAAQRRLTRF